MFECKGCNFSTKRSYDYTRHLNTKKHKKYIATNISENYIFCKYCSIKSHKNNIRRHYSICKKKILYDAKKKKSKQSDINTLIDENKVLKEENRKYIDIILNNALNSKVGDNCMINSNNTINSGNNYFSNNVFMLMNKCKDAPNIEDVMAPKLTDSEKDYIDKYGPINGSIDLLEKRCIDGIDPKNRPFHCTDASRLTFLTKHQDIWMKDPKGQIIINHLKKPVFEYANRDIHEKSYQKVNIMIDDIKKFSTNGHNVILKNLVTKSHYKNIKEI